MLTATAEVAADNGALSSEAEARHALPALAYPGGDKTGGGSPGRQLSTAMLLRELVFCAALALTTYGALHTSGGKVWWAAGAVRFFPPESPVQDWYRGQLTAALAAAARADVSLVMYYAPWDAECQHVRREFDRAARLLGDQVHFTAINCWNPGSECRLQHNKIPSWPVIMAYTVNSKGVLYRGPRDAHSMVRFLELIMRPLTKVSTVEDLVNLVGVCDAVAVAFTPLEGAGGQQYAAWWGAALARLQHDPRGELCLAVVTAPPLAAALGVRAFPALRYLLWNQTLEYGDAAQSWSEQELVTWLLRTLRRPAERVSPAWHKSFSFQPFADGPMLVLFTPLNPLHDQQPAYDLLREVAMEYRDCAGSEWTREVGRLQRLQRSLYRRRERACAGGGGGGGAVSAAPRSHAPVWHNATGKNGGGLLGMLLKDELVKVVTGAGKEDMLYITPPEECGSGAGLEAPEGEREQCVAPLGGGIADLDMVETSMLPAPYDELAAARLAARHAAHACRLARFAATRGATVAPARGDHLADVRGLACRSNWTLSFLALDSVREHHFAESLGIDLDSREDKTALVILDSKLESQYVLTEAYSEASLRRFIARHAAGRAARTLRSPPPRARHTHYYGSPGAGGGAVEAGAGGELRVAELTGRQLRRLAGESRAGKVSVVLICGGACPSHVTRSALTAARLLAHYKVTVEVVRVDARRHDLAWPYTSDRYPTIHVFPADRRAEGVSYPAGERVSADGVVALVMRTLAPAATLRVQLAVCDNTMAVNAKRECINDIRRHVSKLIGRTLQHWRRVRSAAVRSSLVARLEHLRRVSLGLETLRVDRDRDTRAGLAGALDGLSRAWDGVTR